MYSHNPNQPRPRSQPSADPLPAIPPQRPPAASAGPESSPPSHPIQQNFIFGAIDPCYLLAVVNSTYIAFAYNNLVREAGRVFPQVKITHVRKLPLAIPPKQIQEEIGRKVKAVLAAKHANPEADTTVLEQEIDQHVYALYGLTPDEIKIVEESAK